MRPPEDSHSASSTWLVVLHKGTAKRVGLSLQDGTCVPLHVQRWLCRQRGISLSTVAVTLPTGTQGRRYVTHGKNNCCGKFCISCIPLTLVSKVFDMDGNYSGCTKCYVQCLVVVVLFTKYSTRVIWGNLSIMYVQSNWTKINNNMTDIYQTYTIYGK